MSRGLREWPIARCRSPPTPPTAPSTDSLPTELSTNPPLQACPCCRALLWCGVKQQMPRAAAAAWAGRPPSGHCRSTQVRCGPAHCCTISVLRVPERSPALPRHPFHAATAGVHAVRRRQPSHKPSEPPQPLHNRYAAAAAPPPASAPPPATATATATAAPPVARTCCAPRPRHALTRHCAPALAPVAA